MKNFSIGDATKIDEYVPIKTPKIIAKEKPLRISPPKINIENSANKVVIEVIIVRARVSFIDKLAMSLTLSLMKYYIDIQKILRGANISTEIYPGESKLKKQMEYANKIKSPAVILYGENEIKIGKPTLRQLTSGEEKSIKIEDLVNEIQKII